MRVNGKPLETNPERLLDLLASQGIAPDTKGIAVAVNGSVVPRSTWAETSLANEDEIEIVKIMQGG
ncbi:MAG TPA: sulfur carrier protein ThiS [Polyangium sp.]|jgi:sulfur carrier protein|nr:sulfur carrier protein ThiS [Polyangium sp.]